MSTNGGADLTILARTALLDALEALREHRASIVVVGAQAVYLHTGSARVALAEATSDSDIAIDPRTLGDHPLIDEAMLAAGFTLPTDRNRLGTYFSPTGIQVDLMVPEALNESPGRRGARVPPHPKESMMRTRGLEAAVVDNAPMIIRSLVPGDSRSADAIVAGPSALIVAKMHKISDRVDDGLRRNDKDAHDVYRMLVACRTQDLAPVLARLAADQLAGPVTRQAIATLNRLFAQSAQATGSVMAGRAETGVGDPVVVSAATQILAEDLIQALRELGTQGL